MIGKRNWWYGVMRKDCSSETTLLQASYTKVYGKFSPSTCPRRKGGISTIKFEDESRDSVVTEKSLESIDTSEVSRQVTAIEKTALSKSAEQPTANTTYSTAVTIRYNDMASNEKKLGAIIEKIKETGTICIFLSSPFDGCEEERKIFMETTFLQLTSMCDSKGIFLSVVDMRWGITDELSRSSKTIGTCLQAIDDTTIFIGYFGARYGSSNLAADPNRTEDTWIDKDIDACGRTYPFLKEYQCGRPGYTNCSITEMEWLHAFVHGDNKTDSSKPICLFAFRDARYDRLQEQKWMAEEKDNKAKVYRVENLESRLAYDNLQQFVKHAANYCSYMEDYHDPAEGAGYMGDYCLGAVDRLLGFLGSWDEFSEVNQPHMSFAKTRLQMFLPFDDAVDYARMYLVGSDRYRQGVVTSADVYLPDKVKAGSSPFVLCGASGSGKSSLMAYLALKALPPAVHAIYHFCGCNNRSTYLLDLLEHVYAEFGQYMKGIKFTEGITLKAFESMDPNVVLSEIYSLFRQLQELNGGSLELALFLDAINQLVDESYTENALDLPAELKWLPEEKIPSGLKVVISCLPRCQEYAGTMMAVLEGRKYHITSVRTASVHDREEIVRR
jgi:hypothetical protein